MAVYGGGLFGFAVNYGKPPPNGEGPRCCPINLVFDRNNTNYDINLNGVAPIPVSQILTIFIDNSTSPNRTSIYFPIGGETIVAEPFSRGFYPVATNVLSCTVTNAINRGTCNVTVVLYNVILPPIVTSLAPIKIGANDVIVSDRIGTQQYIQTPNVNAIRLMINSQATTPSNYFITNYEVTYSQPSIGGAIEGISWFLYDCPDLSGNLGISVPLASGSFYTPNDTTFSRVSDGAGIMLSGKGNLFFTSNCTSPIVGSLFSVNVFGGLTNASF